jgi:hypothetical protein
MSWFNPSRLSLISCVSRGVLSNLKIEVPSCLGNPLMSTNTLCPIAHASLLRMPSITDTFGRLTLLSAFLGIPTLNSKSSGA